MRYGEYASRGDYHATLKKDWSYLPVYVEKMKLARKFLENSPKNATIFDLGCGEGVLVNEYRQMGTNISGIDSNYESEFVFRGNLTSTGLDNNSIDMVLCMDVLEHLSFADQELAILEISRILRVGGMALITVPNLAHLASRVTFFLFGQLLRTSTPDRHPGDRPVREFSNMFSKHFKIVRTRGLFPTLPILSLLTIWAPSRVIWLHSIYNRIGIPPGLCFLNAFYLARMEISPQAGSLKG